MDVTPNRRAAVQGKVALVTGAASGIGKASAQLLAEHGAYVWLADIDLETAVKCEQEIQRAGCRSRALALDVSKEEAWKQALDGIVEEAGSLDVLVNSAGIARSRPVLESSFAEWREVLAVNLDGVFLGTKHAAAAMQQTGQGSIINLSSISGITPSGGAAAYCASKAAVRIFSKTVAIELADAGTQVRVNLVTPGGVKTPMWEQQPFFREMIQEHGGAELAFAAMEGDQPSQRFFSAAEVAATVLYFASDESAHLTGTETVLDRGHTG